MAAMTLGSDVVAGERVADVNGKFVLGLFGLTLERFRDFLPDGRSMLHCAPWLSLCCASRWPTT